MYYDRFLRAWTLDPVDYFFISAIATSLITAYIKKRQSEEAKMNRLRESIMKKSPVIKSDSKTLSHLEKVEKVKIIANQPSQYPFIRGGAGINSYDLASQIQDLVLELAGYMKKRALQGTLKIIFSHGTLILELILKQCGIHLDYDFMWIKNQSSTQVIVFAIVSGGSAGFTVSWLSAGASLITPVLLLTTFILRSTGQQILHNIDFAKFKETLINLMENEKVRDTIDITFQDDPDIPVSSIQMSPNQPREKAQRLAEQLGITENEEMQFSTGELDFDGDFNVVKQEGSKELELPNNNNPINTRSKFKDRKIRRAKTVHYSDFVRELDEMDNDNFIDAEILQKHMKEDRTRIRIHQNKEL
jgi:hypothetical protein